MHRRQRIRDAVVTKLTGLPLTGSRVYPTRARNLSATELPALRVYTPSEAAERAGDHLFGAHMSHRVAVTVEVVAKAADDVEDTVDAICEQVEAVIEADPTLGAAVVFCAYLSTETDFEDEDRTVMQAALSFEASVP